MTEDTAPRTPRIHVTLERGGIASTGGVAGDLGEWKSVPGGGFEGRLYGDRSWSRHATKADLRAFFVASVPGLRSDD